MGRLWLASVITQARAWTSFTPGVMHSASRRRSRSPARADSVRTTSSSRCWPRGSATHPITGERAATPNLANLDAAFARLREGSPADTLVVYFAGHGVSHAEGDQDDFYYLTADASSLADVSDPALRDLRTLSGTQLQEFLLRSPAARRVVMFDTCESGAAVQRLSEVRSALSGDAMRAHARARNRTGAWILAGAAANQVAYEASRYGQGVLTYALLEAFAGPALQNQQVMVGALFNHAENRVPQLAQGVGGVQRPFPRRGAQDFHIGELAREELALVKPKGVLPVMVSSDLDFGGQRDRLGLFQTGGCPDSGARRRRSSRARVYPRR